MLSGATVSPVLSVADLAQARKFYTDSLGLREVDAGPDEVTVAGSDQDVVTLHAVPDAMPSRHTVATFEVYDLATEMSDLRSHGVRFEEYDEPGMKTKDGVATVDGRKYAWFKDPSGNLLCLHELEPRH